MFRRSLPFEIPRSQTNCFAQDVSVSESRSRRYISRQKYKSMLEARFEDFES